MSQDEADKLFASISEKDPKQLKKVIQILIEKSKILVKTLEETCEKLEQTQEEKCFWKDNYFHLKETLQKYVDNNAIAPFSYITSLEEELKKEKVTKSCLQEKFKVMQPRVMNSTLRVQKRREESSCRVEKPQEQTTVNRDYYRSHSSSVMKEEPRFQNKHKIGPKNIQFFKFKEHRVQ